MSKRVTDKQLAANRRNARKSTGPRTPRGREVSKMNALKHGILSKQVLVAARHHRESGSELEALHRRFWDQLQPSGPLEEMLVDQIVTAHWRLRRALTAEAAEIALGVDAIHRDSRVGVSPSIQWMKWSVGGDAAFGMEESSIGNALLGEWLRDVREAVERDGRLTEAAVQSLADRFGGRPNGLVRSLETHRLEQDAAAASTPDPTATEKIKAATLAFLNQKINIHRYRLEQCADEEEQEQKSRQAAAVLPSPEVLDKILRYETKLERQMYRAMAQLERVQRMRSGEAIPAPLSVDLSERP